MRVLWCILPLCLIMAWWSTCAVCEGDADMDNTDSEASSTLMSVTVSDQDGDLSVHTVSDDEDNNVGASSAIVPVTVGDLERIITRLEERLICLESAVDHIATLTEAQEPAGSCHEIHEQGNHFEGIHMILAPWSNQVLALYCRGEWTVIQQRFDNTTRFDRTWEEYRVGFGTFGSHSNFWLGLETIHQLTTNKATQLRVEVTDWDGTMKYAEYAGFTVGDEQAKYRINTVGHRGHLRDVDNINGQQFFTKDKPYFTSYGYNCNSIHGDGGWWFSEYCGDSNLNGLYGYNRELRGIIWRRWKFYHSFKESVMLINWSD